MSTNPTSHREVAHKSSGSAEVHAPKMPAGLRSKEQAQNRLEVGSTANFLDSLRITLKWEGGYSNDPDDPGHATMLGITQAEYSRYRAANHLAPQHVRQISTQEMKTIYKENFWDAAGCANMSRNIATVNFDTAVNCGLGGARSVMRRALELSGFSQNQLNSLNSEQEASFLAAHTQARMERYNAICQRWENNGKARAWKFMGGWSNRTCDVAKFVGVDSSVLAKICGDAALGRATGTARDWVMPNVYAGGQVLMSLFGSMCGGGGSALGFLGSLFSVPPIELQLGEPQKPPMETRCFEQREDLPEQKGALRSSGVKKIVREELQRATVLQEAQSKINEDTRTLRERLKREQQELQAALARPAAHSKKIAN